MTTKEEFSNAIKFLTACKATIRCGCKYDEVQADWLYFQCKTYMTVYKERLNKEVK